MNMDYQSHQQKKKKKSWLHSQPPWTFTPVKLDSGLNPSSYAPVPQCWLVDMCMSIVGSSNLPESQLQWITIQSMHLHAANEILETLIIDMELVDIAIAQSWSCLAAPCLSSACLCILHSILHMHAPYAFSDRHIWSSLDGEAHRRAWWLEGRYVGCQKIKPAYVNYTVSECPALREGGRGLGTILP